VKPINTVTIITLTYNNSHLLRKAIESVSSQIVDEKFKLEYLVVDDGSRKFDFDYVDGLLKYSGLNYKIIVNDNNIGTVASFNNAIKMSNGDIILPLACDDEFYDEFVVRDVIDAFIKTDSLIITACRVPVVFDKDMEPLPPLNKRFLFNSPKRLLKHLMIKGNIISGASTYYSRYVFEQCGFFDEQYRLLEDYPYYIKALSQGFKIKFIERNVIRYGMEGVSSIGNMNPLLVSDYKRLYRQLAQNSKLNYLERRYLIFRKVMDSRKQLIRSWRYPEQVFILLCLKGRALFIKFIS